MLKDRLTASSGEPGSSNDPVLASTHFPLKAAASTRLGQAAGALLPHGRPKLDSNWKGNFEIALNKNFLMVEILSNSCFVGNAKFV